MEITNDSQKLTFKEAEAILDLAAQLSIEEVKLDETFSVEELFKIAQEANIPAENVRQALETYSQKQSLTISEVSHNNWDNKHSILSLIQGCFSFVVALVAFKEVFPYTRKLGIDILTEFLKTPGIDEVNAALSLHGTATVDSEFFFASPFKLLGAIAISSIYLSTIIIFSNFILLTSYIATKISFFLFKFLYSKVILEKNKLDCKHSYNPE